MASTQDRTEFISEVVNMLAGPVSAGMKKAGEANQRRLDLQEHLEQIVEDARRAGDVARRMVTLLDEIEQPLREAVPQFARAAKMLGQILDEAPDDLADQMRSTWQSVNSLVDGLGPLLMLAQGAAGMFGGSGAPTSASSSSKVDASRRPGTAKKASTASTPSKQGAKKPTRVANKAVAKNSTTVKKSVQKKSSPSSKMPPAKKKASSKK